MSNSLENAYVEEAKRCEINISNKKISLRQLFPSAISFLFFFSNAISNATSESRHVAEHSAEFCCDDSDFCNEHLTPKKSVISNEIFTAHNEPEAIVDEHTATPPLFASPLNIAFLGLFSALFLAIVILLAVLCVRRRRQEKRIGAKRKPNPLSLSSGSSTTSSEKSKLTTRSALTTATSVPAEKSEPLVLVAKGHLGLVGQGPLGSGAELLEPLIGVSFCLFCLFIW